jgi:RNA polymerase subunit RPABC4/transcription elongation factor Spt4
MRSDVFSLGLIFYRMFAGFLPEWPFHWPPPGFSRISKTLHPDLIALIRRALSVDHRKRFADAEQMRLAFNRIRPHALRPLRPSRRRRRTAGARTAGGWRTLRFREFQRRFKSALGTRAHCGRCGGPVSEPMHACPWCGIKRQRYTGPTPFPQRCSRCRRGVKADWRFCPWCFGAAISDSTTFRYSDKRYTERCPNADCFGKKLMPYMRYCCWCRRKVRLRWGIPGLATRCENCRWGVIPDYWDFCPWCARRIRSQ